ncbi:hypothetical protein H2248_001514 [Termitomyces sp. 'cryptogamus']|nr:hypothetical protein H2248_001514 [Termitomyces sp. 'cryptogamus']
MSEETKGASNNERLLAAARSDNEDLILEIFEQGGFDINCVDGLGNTRMSARFGPAMFPLKLIPDAGSTS